MNNPTELELLKEGMRLMKIHSNNVRTEQIKRKENWNSINKKETSTYRISLLKRDDVQSFFSYPIKNLYESFEIEGWSNASFITEKYRKMAYNMKLVKIHVTRIDKGEKGVKVYEMNFKYNF